MASMSWELDTKERQPAGSRCRLGGGDEMITAKWNLSRGAVGVAVVSCYPGSHPVSSRREVPQGILQVVIRIIEIIPSRWKVKVEGLQARRRSLVWLLSRRLMKLGSSTFTDKIIPKS